MFYHNSETRSRVPLDGMHNGGTPTYHSINNTYKEHPPSILFSLATGSIVVQVAQSVGCSTLCNTDSAKSWVSNATETILR